MLSFLMRDLKKTKTSLKAPVLRNSLKKHLKKRKKIIAWVGEPQHVRSTILNEDKRS